jgi:AraC-like DNA-binding protein
MIYSIFYLSFVLWYREGYILQMPFMMRSVNPLMFLTMPFFYFFVRNTINGQDKLRPLDFIHFIPAIIHIIELLPFYLLPYDQKYLIAQSVVKNPRLLNQLAKGFIYGESVDIIRLILQYIYFFIALRLLLQKEILNKWGKEGINIRNWLFAAVFFIGLMLLAHGLYFVKDHLTSNGYQVPAIMELVVYLFIILPIIALNIYLRINQRLIYGYTIPAIFQIGEALNDDKLDDSILNNDDSLVSALPSNINIDKLEEDLIALMHVEKLYLNQELSLSDLAGRLNISQRVLSQFINKKYNIGVREYINQYRIQTAIELIQSGFLENRSIEGLCLSVGFKSRVTFFLAFKKYTGTNPSEFQKMNKKS